MNVLAGTALTFIITRIIYKRFYLQGEESTVMSNELQEQKLCKHLTEKLLKVKTISFGRRLRESILNDSRTNNYVLNC